MRASSSPPQRRSPPRHTWRRGPSHPPRPRSDHRSMTSASRQTRSRRQRPRSGGRVRADAVRRTVAAPRPAVRARVIQPKPAKPATGKAAKHKVAARSSGSARRGQINRPQPRVEPGAGHRQAGLRVLVLALAQARQRRVSLGLRRPQQRLPDGPRRERLRLAQRRLLRRQAAPRPEGRTTPTAGGKVRTYAVRWWRVVEPTPDAAWAWASLSSPSMTLQTCLGRHSEYRLIVRLVQVG